MKKKQHRKRAPVKTGWADATKGTTDCPNVRSRWIARQYNTGPRPDFFTATSPLEEVKLVISEVASSGRNDVLKVLDVRRAYFYALPDEDKRRAVT